MKVYMWYACVYTLVFRNNPKQRNNCVRTEQTEASKPRLCGPELDTTLSKLTVVIQGSTGKKQDSGLGIR